MKMGNDINLKQFRVYLIFAFVLAYILQIVSSIFFNQGNKAAFQILMMICMFMPFAATLISRIPLKGMGWVPHLKGKVRYIFFALWVPALLSILGGLLFFIAFPNAFDPDFQVIKEQMGDVALSQMEAQGITIPIYLAFTTIQAITIAPFLNMIFALGEEIGWRGVLYPYLKNKFGVTKGRIIGGAIWGAWHWPVMLLAGYEYGKEYIGEPILGPIVFCVATVLMGVLLDYVYEKTDTIWAPALMHGAINAFTIFGFIMKPEYADKMIFGPMYIGIISMMPMIFVVFMICWRTNLHRK